MMTSRLRRLVLAMTLVPLSWAVTAGPTGAQEEVAGEDVPDEDVIPILPDAIPQVEEFIEGPDLGGDEVNVIVNPERPAAPAPPGARGFYYPIPWGPPIASPLYQAARAAGGPEPAPEPTPREEPAPEERGEGVVLSGSGEPEAFAYAERLQRLRELHQSARGETRKRLAKAIDELERQRDRIQQEQRELARTYQRALRDITQPRG